MPIVRTPTPGEIDRAGEIGSIAFELNKEEWQQAFHRHADKFGIESLIVVEHEGQLVSSMTLAIQPMWMNETLITGAAVGGVGTIPEARKMGCAAAMMQETVRRMREWGLVGSPMWPFSFAYYRKFGWEMGGEARALTWPRDITWQIEPRGEIVSITPDKWQDVASVWDAAAKRVRCATARTAADWARPLAADDFGGGASDKGGVLCYQDGCPAAYALYRIPEDNPEKPDEVTHITEIRALNPAAEVAVLNEVAKRSPHEKLCGHFSRDNAIRSLAVNPRAMSTEMDANFGIRIVDPVPILDMLKVDGSVEPVVVGVRDVLQGDHAWKVHFEGGQAHVEPVTADPDAVCSIQTFSSIASGLIKPQTAAEAGLLTGDAKAIATLHAGTAGWGTPFRSYMEAG